MHSPAPFRLILASASRYRQELLGRLQLPFEAIAADLDETPQAGESPQATAQRLAREKAEAVARQAPGALVIGSDQVAVVGGQQIGKPGSHENALRQLLQLRGQSVAFHTALCLLDGRPNPSGGRLQFDCALSLVSFRDLPEHELDAYLRIEQPYDCAGSAKNEGLGIALLEKIDSSDPTALTGLPLITLITMLRRASIPFFDTAKQ